MKPKETANRIMDAIEAAEKQPDMIYKWYKLKNDMLKLASELTTAEPSYGHAARIHELTERHTGVKADECPACKENRKKKLDQAGFYQRLGDLARCGLCGELQCDCHSR